MSLAAPADVPGFADDLVLVTGGSRGIGLAIATRFAAAGSRVVVAGRDEAVLDAAAARIGAAPLVMDVTDPHAVEVGVAQIGPISILVNNAGTSRSAPFVDTDEALWQAMLDANLTSAYRMCRAVLPGMLNRGRGRIVNVASAAGLTGFRYVSAYCAAKHGLIGLTRALALEVAKTPITVNAVCPHYVETALVERSLDNIVAKTGRTRAQALETIVASNPQQRLIQPEEVADAVLWLCGNGARSMTGQAIAIAGGMVM